MGIPQQSYASEYQHLLTEWKRGNSITEKWSNPKFMFYLYRKYIYEALNAPSKIKKPKGKARLKVNFDDIWDNRVDIGKKSE